MPVPKQSFAKLEKAGVLRGPELPHGLAQVFSGHSARGAPGGVMEDVGPGLLLSRLPLNWYTTVMVTN